MILLEYNSLMYFIDTLVRYIRTYNVKMCLLQTFTYQILVVQEQNIDLKISANLGLLLASKPTIKIEINKRSSTLNHPHSPSYSAEHMRTTCTKYLITTYAPLILFLLFLFFFFFYENLSDARGSRLATRDSQNSLPRHMHVA